MELGSCGFNFFKCSWWVQQKAVPKAVSEAGALRRGKRASHRDITTYRVQCAESSLQVGAEAPPLVEQLAQPVPASPDGA